MVKKLGEAISKSGLHPKKVILCLVGYEVLNQKEPVNVENYSH